MFKDSCFNFMIQPEKFIFLPLLEQLEAIINIQNSLDVTRGKGYLTTLDLTTYPMIQELLPYFITNADESED
jgi:hypothetical protein